MNKNKILLAAVLVVIMSMLVGIVLENRLQKMLVNQPARITITMSSNRQYGKVARVIDGDTVELETGEKVRYIGMDAPETKDPKKPIQCFGVEASRRNNQLVAGKEIGMEKDVSNTDKFGRLLRYVYLGDKMVNQILIEEGYARVATFPPDVKYKDLFLEAETRARTEQKGLWGSRCR